MEKVSCNKVEEWLPFNEKYIYLHDTNHTNKIYIHDNGGRPYCVCESEKDGRKTIDVYEAYQCDEKVYDEFKYVLIMTCYYENIFYGKDPVYDREKSEYVCTYNEENTGNTVLIHLKDNEYIYICRDIKYFKSISLIKRYVSPVGNNDVPYPYAIDIDNNYYMLENDSIITEYNTENQEMRSEKQQKFYQWKKDNETLNIYDYEDYEEDCNYLGNFDLEKIYDYMYRCDDKDDVNGEKLNWESELDYFSDTPYDTHDVDEETTNVIFFKQHYDDIVRENE